MSPFQHQSAALQLETFYPLNRPTSSPELSFPTPLLFPEEARSAESEECSPPIAVQHAGGRCTARRPPLNPPLTVVQLNKTQLI